ncbi:hypothetical protein N7467_005153 [Penicillium canescens]|nr:hypothetical protein N7467_005153 [Penicillium canescens]
MANTWDVSHHREEDETGACVPVLTGSLGLVCARVTMYWRYLQIQELVEDGLFDATTWLRNRRLKHLV